MFAPFFTLLAAALVIFESPPVIFVFSSVGTSTLTIGAFLATGLPLR